MATRAAAPLSDAVIVAVAALVDDSQSERRDPSHSELEFQITKAGLRAGDPATQGNPVGKQKRIRAVLSWALEHAHAEGEAMVAGLLALIRARGGFREGSPNYVGKDAIQDATNAFRFEGYDLTPEGDLRATLLDNLTGVQLTDALNAYVRRAKRGHDDAALVTGTGKDLLEATAAHVLKTKYGTYPSGANFPGLLGQAFVAAGLVTPQHPTQPLEPAQRRVERAAFELACAINTLRNKDGTGHGRPWLPVVTPAEARIAVEFMGVLAELLLNSLKPKP